MFKIPSVGIQPTMQNALLYETSCCVLYWVNPYLVQMQYNSEVKKIK